MRYLLSICFLMGYLHCWSQNSNVYKRTDHYYERIDAFKKECRIENEDIVFLGNSLIEKGGDWGKRLHRNKVRNRGIIGDDLSGITERIEPIIKGNPQKIFIIAGVNDLSHGLSTDSIAKLYNKLIITITERVPKTALYIQSLLPINESFKRYIKLEGKCDSIPIINDKLKRLAKVHKLHFINLFPLFVCDENGNTLNKNLTYDGLHLNEKGYKIWIEEIKKVLADEID